MKKHRVVALLIVLASIALASLPSLPRIKGMLGVC